MLENSFVNGSFADQIYVTTPTGTTLGSTFAPTLTVVTHDGASEAYSILGGSNANVLAGGSGDDYISGGAGNDMLTGGAGHDILVGGSGYDVLSGGLGSDTFAWKLGDHGVVGTPDLDRITDFDNALPAAGGDILDLRDLLPNAAEGNLTSYLHFEKVVTSSGTDTVLHVSSSGTIGSGGEDLRITLQNVDLTTAGTTDHAIIQDLLTKGKLQTD